MALIIYPSDGWNTFASEADADMFFATRPNSTTWEALTTAQKEAKLTSTASMIRLCKGIVLPDDNEVDLIEGQLHLVDYALKNDTADFDPNSKYITKEKVGDLEVDYSDKRYLQSDIVYPSMTKLYLQQYGCSGGSGSFSQSKVH